MDLIGPIKTAPESNSVIIYLHVLANWKNMYDASKEGSNQQVYVCMLGSSLKLNLFSK